MPSFLLLEKCHLSVGSLLQSLGFLYVDWVFVVTVLVIRALLFGFCIGTPDLLETPIDEPKGVWLLPEEDPRTGHPNLWKPRCWRLRGLLGLLAICIVVDWMLL